MPFLLHALTAFVGGFLYMFLFFMISKMMLPKLQAFLEVWYACIGFFGTALVIGWLYSQIIGKLLRPRFQPFVQIALHVAALVFLVTYNFYDQVDDWSPPPDFHPIFYTLVVLGALIGLPLFVLVSTSFLLLKWRSYTARPGNLPPYLLLNFMILGAVVGHLSYGIGLDPVLTLSDQSTAWTIAFFQYSALVLGCALYLWFALPRAQAGDLK